MNLQMIGIDFQGADIAQREPLSFVKSKVLSILPEIAAADRVEACALLATCNRTELYIHTSGPVDALRLLTAAAGVEAEDYRAIATLRMGEDMVRHVIEVASGLKSQIFGDDQIVTQMRAALELAREAKTTDSVIDTLLRRAVTAGKRVKTETRLSGVPSSAAACGVHKAQLHFGSLKGRRAVVIGNGEMGRLAATLLREAGCDVTITLRSYRHGETIVPAGCKTHAYDDRCALIDGADLTFSATTSPHYTLSAEQIRAMERPPRLLVDLAMPRDIDSAAADDPRVTVWNLDDLGRLEDENAGERAHAKALVDEACAEFKAWYAYREALPVIAELKDVAAERVHYDHGYLDLADGSDVDSLVALAVAKTVDMLLGGMKDIISPERLAGCLKHIKKGCGK